MADQALTPVVIERATEQLRQERATFNQSMQREARWSVLCLVMGYASIVLLATIMLVASYVLLNEQTYSSGVVTTAAGALLVDVLGLVISVWKIALNPDRYAQSGPVTRVDWAKIDAANTSANPEKVSGLS